MRTGIVLLFATALTAATARPDYCRPFIRTATGEECLAGQLVIQLNQSQRGLVNITRSDGSACFGIPALDRLCRKWRIEEIAPLMMKPDPTAVDRKYGLDLQHLVQFSAAQDLAPVLADFLARPEVEVACPNGLMRLDSIPNDPLYSDQWHIPAIGAPYAWDFVRGNGSVVMVFLDDGIEFTHEDLEANVLINPLEDANHNGRFDTLWTPDGDLDGIDQDGNGYTDDVIGFDFYAGDPIPMPSSGDAHGTHVAGTGNAVTNNGIGVAAPPWNVRTLATRCGAGGSINIAAAITGMNYAVSRGVWAVSMSFGSASPNPPMRNACQAAWDAGLVLFAAAGGDGGRVQRYPACYDGVEAVACTGRDSLRSHWTNWGPWIDVCAPGETIMATLPCSLGTYGTMDGTSVATPIAAAAAAWVKSACPAATNAEALEILYSGCVPIDDSLFRIGELGAGIVNIGNVAAMLFNCNLSLVDWRFNDASGNNNGRPDPGETCAVVITYANHRLYRDAAGVRAALSCASAEIAVFKDTARFPDIPAGDSADCSADSFVIYVPDSVPPQPVVFSLVAFAAPEPYHPNSEFKVHFGSLFAETFDGIWSTNVPPTGWRIFHTAPADSGRDDWHRENANTAPWTLHPTPFAAIAPVSSPDAPPDSLISPVINCAGYRNITLICSTYFYRWSSQPYIARLIYSTDGGATWPFTLHDYYLGSNPDPVRESLELDQATGRPNVQLAWVYDGNIQHIQWWSLDDVAVVGEPVTGLSQDPAGRNPVVPSPSLDVHPNPFTRHTTVSFTAPVSGAVELKLLSADGRLVAGQTRTAVIGERLSFQLDGTKLANGTYLVQVVTPGGVYAQKTAVLR